jgi:hypothetical protein
MFIGYLGLVVLVGDIFAIVNILQSAGPTDKKVLWCLLIFFLPLLGLFIWFMMGPGNHSRRGHRR